ncbi:hypothetical protein [Rhodopseudomonas sp.]|uniref:hypothetical protein n=1 Tax=Rhodopseudomonas sp. TaxID=1078 RepID=UPI0039E6D9D5
MDPTPSAEPRRPPPRKTSIGVWAMVAALLVLLGLAVFFAYEGLVVGDVEVPAQGYIAMTIGIAFSLVIGIGLMVLVFYSSRRGYDEQVTILGRRPNDDDLPPPSDGRPQ